MTEVNGKIRLKSKHSLKDANSKEEYRKRVSKLPKKIFGKEGNDAWFHLDALFEDEEDVED